MIFSSIELNWKYGYYYQIYDRYNFPNFQGMYLAIDLLNPSCLSNRSDIISYNLPFCYTFYHYLCKVMEQLCHIVIKMTH
jgi:hypothetical protein